MPQARANSSAYVKLERRLVLLAWLNGLLGFENNRDLLSDLNEAAEGFDSEGRSYIFHRLAGRGEKVKIPPPTLVRYDDNIKAHLEASNKLRAEPITLRYFKYVAILYSEIFLDWYFNHPRRLLDTLNDFIDARNAKKSPGDVSDKHFEESDIGGSCKFVVH